MLAENPKTFALPVTPRLNPKKETKMDCHIEDPQIDPASSFAMNDAVANHSSDLLQILVAAEALQQHLFEKRSSSNAQSIELSIGQWEIAVGAGTEAALVAARMAGFTQAKDGRWYCGQDEETVLLEIPQSFLMTYLSEWADTF